MSKVLPKISLPGSAKFPTKGPHNPNIGTSGSGLAPRPSGGANIVGNDRPSMPTQSGLARVKGAGASGSGGAGSAGSFLPVQNNAMTNLRNQRVGQSNPNTGAVATKKPNRKGGAAFYGEP